MPARIFISYRRDDVAGDARGIRDGLAARFGRGSVFMDVDDLLAGQRFDEELAKALDACNVLIAVIGPRWMDLLRAKMSSGELDYVRAEIAEALRRRIAVIPVHVGRAGQFRAQTEPISHGRHSDEWTLGFDSRAYPWHHSLWYFGLRWLVLHPRATVG
jgi:TIR domain